MPIHGYPGGVISATPPSVTVNGASGVFTTEQQMQYQTAGNWPMPLTQISRSLRFNSADSAYLNRTPASASNRKTWTWSGWIKRSALTGNQALFSANGNVGTSDYFVLSFENTSNVLRFDGYWGGATRHLRDTVSVYRDVSAWYHIVLSVDTTQATDTNRLLVYVNNVNYPFSTSVIGSWPAQNSDGGINSNILHEIGRRAVNNDYSLNAYLTEVNFIDGLALTPASFGVTDPATGVWGPRQYTGPYGTNGFYLNFSDNSGTTSTTLGKDYSGNGNNWTPNNFSVTAGAGNDSLVDTPTPYGTDTGAGGEVRGNYSTLNPLNLNSGLSLANGNLAFSNSGNTNRSTFGTHGMTSGKWYCEVKYSSIYLNAIPGVVYDDGELSAVTYIGNRANGYGYESSGSKYNNGSGSSYGASWTTSDTIGIALDLDNLTVTFYKNGTSQGTAFSSLPSGKTWFFGFDSYGSGAGGDVNFGQRPFAYTAPSGFKALCTQNLPTPTIGATSTTQAGKYFNPVLYNGNSSGASVTGVGFQPDFVWMKCRSTARNHELLNAVTGGSSTLFSNLTNAEATDQRISSFNADGFTYTTNSNSANTGDTFAAWNWKGGGTGVSNTSGTITSTVSANTTAGFSIVTYTGNATQGATVGHGLGVTPAMLIVKSRSLATDWVVQHKSAGTAPSKLILNSTAAVTNSAPEWNNAGGTPTAFNSTVFTIGASGYSVNNSGETYLAYVFAEVAGYSAFGSYVGNGVGFVGYDGPFVYTGFRPRYVLIKVASGSTDMGAGKWCIYDAARNPYNVTNLLLYANRSDAEGNGSPYLDVDILSNGFKIRGGNFGEINGNGNTYIYAAFAENPFKYSLAR